MSMITPRRMMLSNGEVVMIRNPSRSDAAGFVEIMRSVAAEGRYTLAEVDEIEWTIPARRADIDEHNREPGFLSLIAESKGMPIGFLEFENGMRRRTQHAGMFSIFLVHDWRSLGIGSSLIQTMLDWAEESPIIEKVALAVMASNTRAIALYERFGFQVEGRCPRDIKIGNEYLDSLMLYKFVKG